MKERGSGISGGGMSPRFGLLYSTMNEEGGSGKNEQSGGSLLPLNSDVSPRGFSFEKSPRTKNSDKINTFTALLEEVPEEKN